MREKMHRFGSFEWLQNSKSWFPYKRRRFCFFNAKALRFVSLFYLFILPIFLIHAFIHVHAVLTYKSEYSLSKLTLLLIPNFLFRFIFSQRYHHVYITSYVTFHIGYREKFLTLYKYGFLVTL